MINTLLSSLLIFCFFFSNGQDYKIEVLQGKNNTYFFVIQNQDEVVDTFYQFTGNVELLDSTFLNNKFNILYFHQFYIDYNEFEIVDGSVNLTFSKIIFNNHNFRFSEDFYKQYQLSGFEYIETILENGIKKRTSISKLKEVRKKYLEHWFLE